MTKQSLLQHLADTTEASAMDIADAFGSHTLPPQWPSCACRGKAWRTDTPVTIAGSTSSSPIEDMLASSSFVPVTNPMEPGVTVPMPRERLHAGDASRRVWVSKLKEDAVRQLPPDASPSVRAKLRLDVERALRRHAPDAPAPELEDILFSLVAEARDQLRAEKHQAQRADRKRRLLASAKSMLMDAIDGCPAHLVGTLDSDKRAHIVRVVWADLRTVLEKGLSGAESEDEVRQHVEDHVARWQREQDRWWRPRPPSPARVLKGIRNAKAIVDVVNNTPELRQLADILVHAFQVKLRQRRDAKNPPSSPV